MAIEREIPKDINKYKAKLIGPFTARQTVCIIPAALLGIGTFFLLKDITPQDVCRFVSITVALPFFLCGWYSPNGLPFEKFVKTIFVTIVLAPKHRVYKTVNSYEQAFCPQLSPEDKKKEQAAVKKAASYHSKDPNLKSYK